MNRQIKIYFFGHLVDMLYRDNEVLFLPLSVNDVQTLMAHLAKRGEPWTPLFDKHAARLKITVNKQFAELDTPVKGGDEVGFVAFNLS